MAEPTLDQLRARIDRLDEILVHTLAERFRQTAKVGALKARDTLPAFDPDREARQRARIETLAKEAGLDPDFAQHIHGLIVDQVKDNHRKISGEQ
ncbi:chorismate mutase [Palleronia abyssalis]|uniref:chorismate mutase n=1 Tax=Palleronia abyssalis TaxID=1501240 RepID=A0A2R8BWG3_9RHOB|nr:chorismate mutase [Palleronia abyssalis]SPJ24463.1 T-protein [Palleronia abyssalis]